MKTLIALITMTFTIASFAATDTSVLKNCYANPKLAQYTISDIENAHHERDEVVMLYDAQGSNVGYIRVTPQRNRQDGDGIVTNIKVRTVNLCSSLNVDEFYYPDNELTNLLDWTKLTDAAEVSQDEGALYVRAKVKAKFNYATYVQVDFKAYDTYQDVDESQSSDPDYLKDWGLPVGKGTFYFYAPKSVKKCNF